MGESLGVRSEQFLLTMPILSSATSYGEFRIEVTIGAETSAEGDVDVNHDLSKHELCCSEERCLCVGLYSVNTFDISCYIIEVDTHLNLLTLIVNLTRS